MAILAALLLPALAAAQCTTRIRVGTFDEATPGALAIMTDWLNDDADECWTFYRQPSGGLSTAKLESGDLDLAYVGSTPYAAATARRGALKAVAVAHKKGEAQALITRARLEEPSKDLGGTTVAAPYVSTTHYIALAVIASRRHGPDGTGPRDHVAGGHRRRLGRRHDRRRLRLGLDDEPPAQKPLGRQRGPAGPGPHHGPRGDRRGLELRDGQRRGGLGRLPLGGVPELVKKFVVAVARTQNDYVKSVQTGGWSEDYNGCAGRLQRCRRRFRLPGVGFGRGRLRGSDAFARLARFEFLSVADQLDADKIDVPTMTQDSAYFYEQKVLAEDPSGADQVSHYENYYDKTILTGLTTSDYEPLLATDTAFSATNAADVQREVASDPTVPTPRAPRRRLSVTTLARISRTGPRARTPTRTTRTAGGSSAARRQLREPGHHQAHVGAARRRARGLRYAVR